MATTPPGDRIWPRVPRVIAGTAALEQAPCAILWVCEAGSVGYANARAREWLGVELPEAGAAMLWELAPGLDHGRWAGELLPRLREAGRIEGLSEPWTTAEGEKTLTADVAWLDVSGTAFAAFYLSREVAVETDAGEGGGQSCPDYVNLLHEAVAFLGPDLSVLNANPAFCSLVGRSRQEILHRRLGEVIDANQVDPEAWKQLAAGELGEHEIKFRRSSGRVLDLVTTAARLGDDGRLILILEDVSDRRHLEHTLQQSEHNFEVLASNVPGMLYRFVMTPEGKTSFPYCSPGCEEIWGIPPESIRDDATPMVSLIHPDDLGRFQQTVIDSATSLGRWEFEGRMETPEGIEKWFHAASQPELQPSGDIHWQGLLMDISDQKRIEEELKEARNKAEIAARAKADFLANMSHEIRTPMNGVIGMTELLMGTRMDEKQRHYLDTIRSSSEVLLTIINDVLDISKMEAGKLELNPAVFDLRQMIEEVCALLSSRAFKKGIEVIVAYDPKAPTRVVGDGVRLRQVMANLIGNSVKFTSEGHILVEVKCLEEGEERVGLQLRVTDTGIGIAPEAAERLFQKFEQADSSTSRKFGGTGLGLAISQQLIELMDSEISVKSRLGHGSTVQFDLDLPRAPEGSVASAESRLDQIIDRRILVVDDHPVNREMLFDLLTSWGFATDLAESGDQALRLMRERVREKRPIDLVLLDYQMPGMDGLDLALAIRAEPQIAGVEIILVSSSNPDDDAQRQFAKGRIASSMMKPVRQAELKRAMVDAMLPNVGASEEPEELPEEVDVESLGLRILLAEDNEINREVALDMLGNLGCTIDCADDGQMAVDKVMVEAYDVILMDCQMPGKDGFEATREIRQMDMELQPPIIAMTAHAMEGDRQRCIDAGMDDYLSKPVTIDRLREKLARFSRRRKPAAPSGTDGDEGGGSGPGEPPAAGEQPSEVMQEDVFDLDSAKEFAGGSEAMLGKLIGTWAEKVDGWLAELEEALDAGDIDTGRRIAHSMRGASSYIGAKAIHVRSEGIEEALEPDSIPAVREQLGLLRGDCLAFRAAAEAAGLWPSA